jgi:hypothetical protein
MIVRVRILIPLESPFIDDPSPIQPSPGFSRIREWKIVLPIMRPPKAMHKTACLDHEADCKLTLKIWDWTIASHIVDFESIVP